MTITPARQVTLASAYGVDGCITQSSIVAAIADAIKDGAYLTVDDATWLYNAGVCVTDADASNTAGNTSVQNGHALVADIVDGDTIDLYLCSSSSCQLSAMTPTRCRLYHVRASEINTTSGQVSANWLATHVPAGEDVVVENKGLDNYGRPLVILYKDGVNINDLMIQGGYASYWEALDNSGTADVGEVSNTGSTPGATGYISFSSPIAACTITVNGEAVSDPSKVLAKPAGNYRVEVSCPGKKIWSQAVDVLGGKTTPISPSLVAASGIATTGSGAVFTLSGKVELPTKIQLGQPNWFGVEVDNVGTSAGKAYLGIRLINASGTEYEYRGDPTYAKTINSGESGFIWAKFTVPESMTGTLRVVALITKL